MVLLRRNDFVDTATLDFHILRSGPETRPRPNPVDESFRLRAPAGDNSSINLFVALYRTNAARDIQRQR